MIEVRPTAIPGCYELRPKVVEDLRGRFVKVFHEPTFASHGLETRFPEEYYSISAEDVVRGMHFQIPPHDTVKLVYLVRGTVMDVVVDLRVGSRMYGCTVTIDLDADRANMAYIPKGVAHGFYVRSGPATMIYRVSDVYAPEHDSGVLWSSVNAPWPTASPIVSERDRNFPPVEAYRSPFRYE